MRNSVLIVLATLAVAAAQKGQGADGNPHGKRREEEPSTDAL